MYLLVHDPSMPIIYGFSKTHKPEVPFRPIVAGFKHPTYKIAKWLTSRLTEIGTDFQHVVKNSLDVKKELNSFVNANTIFSFI